MSYDLGRRRERKRGEDKGKERKRVEEIGRERNKKE
jgi:hypothetical protein